MAIFKPDQITINVHDDYIEIPSAFAGNYIDDWESGIAFCLIGICTGSLVTSFGITKTQMYWHLNILKSHIVPNYMKTKYHVNFSPELDLDDDIKLFDSTPLLKKTIGYYMLTRNICPNDLKFNINKFQTLLD